MKHFVSVILLVSLVAFWAQGFELRYDGNRAVISKVIDLGGDTLRLKPEALVVFKKGGKLSNGVILGSNNSISAKPNQNIFENVKMEGKWDVDKIYSKWFDFGNDADANSRNMTNLVALSDDNVWNKIFISSGVYPVSVYKNNESVLPLRSKTEVTVDGTLKLTPNKFSNYAIIGIKGVHNVTVKGKGSLIGDVATHLGEKGEWGMGIEIDSSKDVLVSGLTIKECWGDCIYIGQLTRNVLDYSENVTIKDVTCDDVRRQGLSIITGKNVVVKNCKFINTGKTKVTRPGAGIDIEPNIDNTVVQNIVIDNCSFRGNDHTDYGDILIVNTNKSSSITIKNCTLPLGLTITNRANSVRVENCSINRLKNTNTDSDSHNVMQNCNVKDVITPHNKKKIAAVACACVVGLGSIGYFVFRKLRTA